MFQQFLPAICQILSKFIFQQVSAPEHRAIEAINSSPITLPNVEQFKKFFQNILASKFVTKYGETFHLT